MSMTTLAVFQWFNAWNCRSERESIFRTNPFSNLYLIGATGIVIALQVLALNVPFLQNLLHTMPLTGDEWLTCIAVASSILVVEEVRKLIEAAHTEALEGIRRRTRLEGAAAQDRGTRGLRHPRRLDRLLGRLDRAGTGHHHEAEQVGGHDEGHPAPAVGDGAGGARDLEPRGRHGRPGLGVQLDHARMFVQRCAFLRGEPCQRQ